MFPSVDELRTIFLEEEVRELRNQLTTEKGKNTRLMRIVEKKVAKQRWVPLHVASLGTTTCS